MESELRPLGLTVTQYSCLELLSQRAGLSGSDLARGTFVTRQSMHAVLASLQQEGSVERASSAPSGRALPTRLTPAGADRLAAASAAVAQVEQRMLGDLAPQQIAALRGMLAGARDRLRDGGTA